MLPIRRLIEMVKASAREKKSSSLAVKIFAIALILIFTLYQIPKLDFQKIKLAFASVDLFLCALVVMLVALFWILRSFLFAILVRAKLDDLKTSFLVDVNLFTGMVDQILPARSGSVLKWWMSCGRSQIPGSKSFLFAIIAGTFLLEGVLLLSLSLLLICIPGGEQPVNIRQILWILLPILLIMGVVFTFADQLEKWVNKSFLAKLKPITAGFTLIKITRKPSRFLTWSAALLMSWYAQALVIKVLAAAFGFALTWNQTGAALLVINGAILVPVTPAGVGTLQLAIIWFLTQVHIPTETALAYSLVYNILEVAPILVLGTIAALRFETRDIADALESPST